MGLRGPGARPKAGIAKPKRERRPSWQKKGLTRAERVIRFVESLKVTSGAHAGRKFRLRSWQREIIREWYATDAKGRRIVRTGLLSLGRKNGKTSTCSALALCHLLGPEQERRGQIVVGASDRDQSGLIFDEIEAFVADNAGFAAECNVQRHAKIIEHLPSGSKFRALSSDAKK
ncbi:MAG: terminase large subunit domain-containing protein, partial [Burkholderiales bacterium]